MRLLVEMKNLMKTSFSIKKIDRKNTDTLFLIRDQRPDFYDVYKIENITLKFNGSEELSPGLNVIKFQVFENNVEITKKIDRNGYVRTIKTEYVDYENRFLFLPLDNKLLCYKIDNKELIEIEEPFKTPIKRIYRVDNFIIVLYHNGFVRVDTKNLEYSYSFIENLNFVTYVCNNEIVITNNNQNLIENGVAQNFPLEISNYYDNSNYDYWIKSHIDSQKGFLWSNVANKIKGESIIEIESLPLNNWSITGYSDKDKKLTFGTSIITDKGEFDEVNRQMRFNVINEFIEIKFFC